MKFFGRKTKKRPNEPSDATKPATGPVDPAKNKDLIRVYDGYGRELFITRQQWRDSVLLGSLKKAWNTPDDLYQMILSALNDGFRSDVVEATEHLYQIDTDRMRAANLWGVVLMEENRLEEAERVYRDYTSEHGENGVILTNLAKIYAKCNNNAQAEALLWHALELDPNQQNSVGWYEVIHRERGGQDASLAALKRMAALPRSWRAQLWLARAALGSNRLDEAVGYYWEALDHADRPVPADLLMQMSGDLGNHGHLKRLLELAEPHYNVHLHGLMVGNNLLKAHIDLGQMDSARSLLDQLYACKRPDWQQTLSFWDTEIAKARIADSPPENPEELESAVMQIINPIWLPASSPMIKIFPEKPKDELEVSFLGGTIEVHRSTDQIKRQMADTAGRLSRALPLFLAEQTYFGSRARVQTLVPYLKGPRSGFIVSGLAWSDEDAAKYAKQAKPQGDYVVASHILTLAEPWSFQVRLIRTVDSICIASFNTTSPSKAPGKEIVQLANNLLDALAKHAGLTIHSFPPMYHLPPETVFANYLLRLEQLLAVRCSSMAEVGDGFLSGEREIIDGNIQLCVTCPRNPTARLLLAQTLSTMKKARPGIIPEFRDKLVLLQKEKALDEPAQSTIQKIIDEALAN
ncbi:MAG TPA: tetratricopeptide repeat protein [Tepidisphaeraceae bacterium]|nr:tetratricopeptide repeat protein [Tepidisphaeraceae bacterium]